MLSMLGVYVCADCHEKDKRMTQCALSMDKHTIHLRKGTCQICGKKKPEVVLCMKYWHARKNKAAN